MLETRNRSSVLAQKSAHSHLALRTLKQTAPALLLLGLSLAGAQPASGEITEAQFTQLATKILTYLGYAVVAGLTVLVAVLGAQAAWRFFGKFIKA